MKSICLQDWEIRALQEGRKKQIRIPLRLQPEEGAFDFVVCRPTDDCFGRNNNNSWGVMYKRPKHCWIAEDKQWIEFIKSPFGGPGDKLWVKETFREAGCSGTRPFLIKSKYDVYLEYKATYDNPIDGDRGGKTVSVPEMHYGGNLRKDGSVAWSPSIHMPRWASRITLEITDVRVERVNEISEEDAYAEGIDDNNEDYQKAEHFQQGGSPIETGSPATFAFKGLWDKLYPGSWQRGDWVWVISFKRG